MATVDGPNASMPPMRRPAEHPCFPCFGTATGTAARRSGGAALASLGAFVVLSACTAGSGARREALIGDSRVHDLGAVVLTRDGGRLAYAALLGERRVVQVWDVARRRLLATIDDVDPQPSFPPQPSSPAAPRLARPARLALALSPDEARLAVAAEGSATRIYEVPSGRLDRVLDATGSAIAFSPGGTLLAVGGREGVVLYRPPGYQPIARSAGRTTSIAFGPEARFAALATVGRAIVVALPDLAPSADLGPVSTRPAALALSPDGNVLGVIEPRGTVRLWNLPTGRPRSSDGLPAPASAIQMLGAPGNAVSKLVVAAGGYAEVHGLSNLRAWRRLGGDGGAVTAVATSAGGRHVAVGIRGGRVAVWKLPVAP